MHTCMTSYIKTSPPVSVRGRIVRKRTVPQTSEATVSEGLAQGSWLERDSNPRSSGPKASTQPICHHAPRILIGNCKKNYEMIQCDCNIIVVSLIQLLLNKNFFQILFLRFNCYNM